MKRAGRRAPEGHGRSEHLHGLRGVADGDGDAVVAAGSHAGVEHDRDVHDLEAEAGGGAGLGFEVEDRHRPHLQSVEDRVVERHDRHADRGVVGTRVDRFFIQRAELRAAAARRCQRVAEHPRRHLGDDFALQGQRGRDRRPRRGQLIVEAEALVEVERRSELEGVRAGLRVERAVLVFRGEFECFEPERGPAAADLDLALKGTPFPVRRR